MAEYVSYNPPGTRLEVARRLQSVGEGRLNAFLFRVPLSALHIEFTPYEDKPVVRDAIEDLGKMSADHALEHREELLQRVGIKTS